MSQSIRRSRRSTSKSRGRSKSPAPPKKVASSGTTVIPTLVTTDQALIINIVFHALYAVTFFGYGGFHINDLVGAPAEKEGLCTEGGLNVWMGVMNVAFILSLVNCYRNGSDAQKKNLLLGKSIQWGVWFMLVTFTGASEAGDGGFIGTEYIKTCGITFLASVLSRHGANGAKTNPATMNVSNNVGKAFAIIIFANLLHTYNVAVNHSADYIGKSPSPVCQTNNGFFGSMIFLMGLDFVHAMNASGKYQKVALQVIASMNVVFFLVTYYQKPKFEAVVDDFSAKDMWQFNLIATGAVAAIAFWASNN